jgi:hypothetical protein
LKDVTLTENACISENFKKTSTEHQTRVANLLKVVNSKCAFNEVLSRFRSMSESTPTDYQECGKSEFTSGLVVTGKRTSRGEWPFLVALYFVEPENFFCGASLISTQHVLTGDFQSFTFARLLSDQFF